MEIVVNFFNDSIEPCIHLLSRNGANFLFFYTKIFVDFGREPSQFLKNYCLEEYSFL